MPATEPPKFGTSGLRGLVVALTHDLVARHVAGFVTACDTGGTVLVGEDLRPSSPDIARITAAAVAAAGAHPVLLGPLPTPALALAAQKDGAAAIMITGSHIPADRNGLKFYTRGGREITKSDENAIVEAARAPAPALREPPRIDATAGQTARHDYVRRYRKAFGQDALKGLSLGLYAHSSVARDLMAELLRSLGAEVTELSRADTFVPVDTEAVDDATRNRLRDWAQQRFDAILSTDGDADRPLLADEAGTVVPGDILGAVTARYLGASHVVTPVSSNTMVEEMGVFEEVTRTRIGSPFVIAGMDAQARKQVVGFEANGGFLLGFDAAGLAALPTRDAVLPLLAPLLAAKAAGLSLSQLVAALPDRVTAADRVQGIDRPRTADWLTRLAEDPEPRTALLGAPETSCDLTDGIRMTTAEGDIVHLRLSGNAPELRIYAEAKTEAKARRMVADLMRKLTKDFGSAT